VGKITNNETMYKISTDINLSILVGMKIQQICFVKYGMTLFFSSTIYIYIDSNFKIYMHNKLIDYDIGKLSDNHALLNLVDKKIIKVNIEDERRTLILCFESNERLILESDEMYESFEIYINEDRFIV
jgi:hypothetical protein